MFTPGISSTSKAGVSSEWKKRGRKNKGTKEKILDF
jgi:hypothetical protein